MPRPFWSLRDPTQTRPPPSTIASQRRFRKPVRSGPNVGDQTPGSGGTIGVVDDEPDESGQEWKLRAGSVPVALALALAFHSCSPGHFAQRTALTMPLHELGHAFTAWWCGFGAIPTLWKTLIPESRSVMPSLLAAGFTGFVLWRAWMSQQMALFGLGLALGVLLFAGTVASSTETATMAITFGGDAGAMILGSALMLCFFVGPSSRLRAGGLRFGLVGIGAAALVDTFATWWSARTNPDVIPFGEIEGVGLSDPSKLDELHGWTVHQIVDRYVLVGGACLAVVLATWAWSTWRAKLDA